MKLLLLYAATIKSVTNLSSVTVNNEIAAYLFNGVTFSYPEALFYFHTVTVMKSPLSLTCFIWNVFEYNVAVA